MKLHTRVYQYYYYHVTFANVGGFLAVSFIKMCKFWKRRSLCYLFLIKVDLFCCPYLDCELAVRRGSDRIGPFDCICMTSCLEAVTVSINYSKGLECYLEY